MSRLSILWFVIFLLSAVLSAAFAPLEKTLGVSARVVYFHGAWVWTAMLAFLAASLVGLLALALRREGGHTWSRALGWTGLFFWVTFLPMSLYVMQANWNGLFLDEPRFRVPLNLAIVGLLLQAGLLLLPPVWTSLANIVYSVALFAGMSATQTVLHPESPIFGSEARGIQLYFAALVVLLALAAWQMARWWQTWLSRRKGTREAAHAG